MIDDNEVDGIMIKYTIKKGLQDRIGRLRELWQNDSRTDSSFF